MWVDPPNRPNTLPIAPWLSQTSAGGQRSGLAFLCPNPPWVPTCPLSRGSPQPVTHATHGCSIFLSISVFPCLTNRWALLLSAPVSHFILLCYFFHSSALVFLFCYHHLWSTAELTCLQGKQPPSFSCSFCLSLLLSLHSPLPVPCPAVALEGSVYPAAAEAGFICPRASPWKGIFHLWRLAHCLRWHRVPNCATSKFRILGLQWQFELLNLMYSWPAVRGIPLRIDMGF